MLIQCLLNRKDGTHVELDETTYHFKPTPTDPRHLAEVLIKAHAQRFLSISEGYVYAGEGEAPVFERASGDGKQSAAGGMPRTSPGYAASYTVGERVVSLPELTLLAFKESAFTIDEWNAQDDEDLHEHLDTTLQELRDAADDQANRKPPERGNVLQPAPEEGLADDDDDGDAGAGAGAGADQDFDSGTGSDGDAGDAGAVDNAMPDHEKLVELYKEKMRRAPSKQLSDERIWQLLNEAD